MNMMKIFFNMFMLIKNLLTLIEISDREIVEQFLPSQVSIRPASEDENSDEDEEPDLPPTDAADARQSSSYSQKSTGESGCRTGNVRTKLLS